MYGELLRNDCSLCAIMNQRIKPNPGAARNDRSLQASAGVIIAEDSLCKSYYIWFVVFCQNSTNGIHDGGILLYLEATVTEQEQGAAPERWFHFGKN